MKTRNKDQMVKELSRFLQIENISWHLLPEEDLTRLYEAIEKLRSDAMELLALLDESRVALLPEDSKKLWRTYIV